MVGEQPLAVGEAEEIARPIVDRAPQFPRRASNVLLLFALLGGAGLLLVIGVAGARLPPGELALDLGLAVATVAAAWGIAAGLDRGRAWAPQAAVVVLWFIAVNGLVQVAIELLAKGSIRIPIDTLLAAWALSAWDRPPLRPRSLDGAGLALAAVLLGVLGLGTIVSLVASAARPAGG